MTQIPAGWYPDPAPAPPGGQPQHRYWDGQQWTEHVQPAPARVEETQPINPYDAPGSAPQAGQPGAYQGSYGQQPGQYGASYPSQPGTGQPGTGQPGTGQYGTGQYGASYPSQPGTGQYGASYPTQYGDQLAGVARTPDGQRLAGWWRRLGAYLLDGILIGVLSSLLGWSFLHRVIDGYRSYVDAVVKASENGTTAPSQGDLLSQVAGATAGFTVVAILVSLLYNALFLKSKAATPGKLALGMRVRLRERPGPLTWGTILLRWLVQNVATLLNIIPGVGTIAGIFPLIDGLWPLWDGRKQALHDKAAKTNVVLVRG